MYSGVCAYPYCNQPFTSKRKKECCCRSCSSRLGVIRTNRGHWSPDEEMTLEILAGTLPFPDLCKRMRMLARKRGWPIRSNTAVRVRIDRLGLSQRCKEDNFSRTELSRLLGVHPCLVRKWINSYGLGYRKIARSQIAISIDHLKAFFQAHPQHFADIPLDKAAALLGDDFTQAIYQRSLSVKPRRRRCRPVLCVDTGEVFPSVRAAGRAKFITYSAILDSMRRGGRSGGYQWQYVNQSPINKQHKVSHGFPLT